MAVLWCSVSSVGIQRSGTKKEERLLPPSLAVAQLQMFGFVFLQLETLLERSSGSQGGASPQRSGSSPWQVATRDGQTF